MALLCTPGNKSSFCPELLCSEIRHFYVSGGKKSKQLKQKNYSNLKNHQCKRIKLVSSAAGDSREEPGYGHMIHSYPLSATQLQIKLALISH